MSKLETNTIDTISGSTNLTLGGTNATDITIPSGVTITNNGTQSGFGGVNTPYFYANGTGSQSPSDGVLTKVQFNNEVIDSDGCYDPTTNYRFTPTTAGKYYVEVQVNGDGGASQLQQVHALIYKNGSVYQSYGLNSQNSNYADNICVNVSTIVDMNGTTDYLEGYGRVYDTSANGTFGLAWCYFHAHKLID